MTATTTLSPTYTSTATKLVPLRAAVQNYAWGLLPGMGSLVARMHAMNATSDIDYMRPYAELWMGTHPSGPARISETGAPLSDFLRENEMPAIPYLLKILSVAKPLSIQAHPDKHLATQLHQSNPAAYKDDNHKPEMCVALTEFEGMCNFRPISEITAHLEQYPEFANLCGGDETLNALRTASKADQKRDALKAMFSSLMTASQDGIVGALEKTAKRSLSADNNTEADKLFGRLIGYYPDDVGCFAAYLLNFVRIQPGQAFFMAANEPHAYLKGQCVEIMACSDNVVRAGLTPKFKDVSTLINMLTYQDGPPEIMNGEPIDKYSKVYRPPVDEFQLTKCVIPAGTTHKLQSAKGHGMILVLDGSGWINISDKSNGEQDKRLPLSPGSVYFIQESQSIVVESVESAVPGAKSPDLFFFRAGINQR